MRGASYVGFCMFLVMHIHACVQMQYNVSSILSSATIPRYTRMLVDDGNDRYNLIVLCWGPGHKRYKFNV